MKKTSKELLDFFGLKVGDRVEITEDGNEKCEYEVKYFGNFVVPYRLVGKDMEYSGGRTIFILTEYEYEVLKPKKKVHIA